MRRWPSRPRSPRLTPNAPSSPGIRMMPKTCCISGYAHGAERLERKAAVVSFTRGKGKVVMFGFRVQHRAQTEGTFQMLFNAIEWGGME